MRVPSTVEGSLEELGTSPTVVVADNMAAVVTVAGAVNSGLLDDVAENADVVKAVGNKLDEIDAVAAVAVYLPQLTANLSNLEVIVDNLAPVLNCSNNMAMLLLLHGRMAEILEVLPQLPNIEVLASMESEIEGVYRIIPQIVTLVAHMQSVIDIADKLPELEEIFANLDDIFLIGVNIAHVVNVSTNMDTILQASTYVEELNQLVAQLELLEANVIALEASARTQAGIATSKASEASSSATSALASKNAAGASAVAAASSATQADRSATNASGSATAANTSAGNAHGSATTAAGSAAAANTSRINAATSATEAKAAESAAELSETNAKASETKAKLSETAAKASETVASTKAGEAATSASSALASKNAAATSATSASTSATTAGNKAEEAIESAAAAASSATAAGTSKDAAAGSATSAKNSADSAIASRNAAAASATSASNSAGIAGVEAGKAEVSANNAADEVTRANAAASTATTEAGKAKTEADKAKAEAATAKSEADKAIAAANSASISAAMSQSEFEAIRAQNQEQFAASGFVHFGKHYTGANVDIVNQGLWFNYYVPNTFYMGRGTAESSASSGTSKTVYPTLNVAGVLFDLLFIGSAEHTGRNAIKLPPAPDGKTTYNKATGAITTYATAAEAFAAATGDVEVVTDRVDMWGFEAWPEEVSESNPLVYPFGLINSQAATMEGVATSTSARPVTYYAVFDGDTSSKGKGLNFFALTDVQKRKVLGNPKHNLYYTDDGKLVQWRLRQRTIAGAGNGDWVGINSNFHNAWNSLKSGEKSQNFAQATLNAAPPPGINQDGLYIGIHSTGWNKLDYLGHKTLGVFNAVGRDNQYPFPNSVGNECYFLVCGTVNRLNQGVYHPSFNPQGTAACVRNVSERVAGQVWYATNMPVTNLQECFNGPFAPDIPVTVPGRYADTGSITSVSTIRLPRPDARGHDAIYPSGQGGVCHDMRYSAHGVTKEDFAEADQRVKNGSYRGFDELTYTQIMAGSSQGRLNGIGIYHHDTLPSRSEIWLMSNVVDLRKVVSVGETIHIMHNNETVSCVIFNVLSDQIKGRYKGTVNFLSYADGNFTSARFVLKKKLPTSVGGSFLQTDVIGDPSRILATPALANGWQGSWIPDFASDYVNLSRKQINPSSEGSRIYTADNGVSWAKSPGTGGTEVLNTAYYGGQAVGRHRVFVAQYQAFAKQTEPAVNAVVYAAGEGVGDVAQYAGYYTPAWGANLIESLIDKIGKSSVGATGMTGVDLIETIIRPTGVIAGNGADVCTHPIFNKPAPNNNSPAFKAISYNVNLNQQASIQYAYTELIHNGTNWGDDGKITIIDNQGTKTDLNGNAVACGTAKLREPIGWVRNKA